MLVEYRDTRHTFAVVVCGTNGDSHIFKSTSDELGRINRTHITLLILVRRFYTAPTHQLGVFFDVILGAGCFAFGLLLRNHRWSWKAPLITRKVEENPRSSVAVSHFLLNYYSIYIECCVYIIRIELYHSPYFTFHTYYFLARFPRPYCAYMSLFELKQRFHATVS